MIPLWQIAVIGVHPGQVTKECRNRESRDQRGHCQVVGCADKEITDAGKDLFRRKPFWHTTQFFQKAYAIGRLIQMEGDFSGPCLSESFG